MWLELKEGLVGNEASGRMLQLLRDLGSFRHKGKPGEGFEWWEDWFDLILKHHYDRRVENT